MFARLAESAMIFQSTLPARGATISLRMIDCIKTISIHAPRTGSDAAAMPPILFDLISIHAPRTGSDRARCGPASVFPAFQSTLPARGATFRREVLLHLLHRFQSTLPARGATRNRPKRAAARRGFQSTLPARGATKGPTASDSSSADFNPRSPHGERLILVQHPAGTSTFQSTLPARGATFLITT